MFDFLIRRFVVSSAQRAVDKLQPKVGIHIPRDLPLPSIGAVKRMSATVARINALEDEMKRMTDSELKMKTKEFRQRFHQAVSDQKQQIAEVEKAYYAATSSEEREELGLRLDTLHKDYVKAKQKALDDLLPEAFAVVRETGRRVLGMRHYDVQLVGGMVLHQGKIAEMATGEGKTLVATLPAYLNGLTGEGVHIVTVNDYLARRDREWMGPVYEFLGLTVGVILHDMSPEERKAAYGADITYGTNNEFGFDYLRDNMVSFKEEMVQREHVFAIVDEVDSILIDEARTPLIISGPAEESTDKYYTANAIAARLKGRRITESEQIEAKARNEDIYAGYDYIADEKARSISLSDEGEEKAARAFGVSNLHEMDTIEYRHHIFQALKAKEFFKRDVDYVVRDGQVIIVDEFTGRLMPGRRWSDGLHQAVEAKEGIKIERENQTLASITFQNYFRMYDKLAGMTGTADTEATEFKQIYNLDVVVMPTNKILRRTNYTDSIYKTVREKFSAVVDEVVEYNKRGQPVLVGTISIEKSERLSEMLKTQGIPHEVLNAKYHEREAHIVAQAGRYKAVTIATNMAGRGTDIVLGGNPEFLAKALVEEKYNDAEDTEKAAAVEKFLDQFRAQCREEQKKVVEAGGLHVIGTERHESRRIDNQLRGRSGRQGDPGSSKFFVSLEDDLMRLFASDRVMGIMERLGMEEGQVIEHPWVSRAIEVAQKRVETHNFEIRKQLLEFDNVMNKQREAVYGLRRSILESDNVRDRILEAIEDTAGFMAEQFAAQTQEAAEEGMWDVEGLSVYFRSKMNVDLSPEKEKLLELTPEEIIVKVKEEARRSYERKEKEEVPAEDLRRLEKFVLLHTIDSKWKDHLYAMDQLKEGVGLRAYGQRDPIIEYKREGFAMFQEMFASINQEVAEMIFKIQPVEGRSVRMRGVFDDVEQNLVHDDYSGLSAVPTPLAASSSFSSPASSPEPKPQPYRKAGEKVGRNDPCPCGSGKKYKKCCGR